MRDDRELWDIIEAHDPEIWPGSTPWSDVWGSFGTTPDANGLGCSVERTRVPQGAVEEFWEAVERRYRSTWPRFRIGPRDTTGLSDFLARRGYLLESVEEMLVLEADQWHRVPDVDTQGIRRVTSTAELREVIRLDHQVFGGPLLDEAGLARELARLGVHRQLFYIPGENGTARAAGGWTRFPGWVLFWGGETHPDRRHQGLYRQILRARVEALEPESPMFIGILANVDTSAPILLRLGFRSIGRSELWRPPTGR